MIAIQPIGKPVTVGLVGSTALLGSVPSVQKIGAVLRKAGFSRSVRSTTCIRGWHNYSQGYAITKRYGGEIRVEYNQDPRRKGREDEMLQKYAAALSALGGKLIGKAIVFLPNDQGEPRR